MGYDFVNWSEEALPKPEDTYSFWIYENGEFNDFTLKIYTERASTIKDDVTFFITVVGKDG